MRSEIAKFSGLGIDTSLREELELIEEIARLNNIIKEVREYIEKYLEREYFDTDILETNTIYNKDLFKVKQILDKENNK